MNTAFTLSPSAAPITRTRGYGRPVIATLAVATAAAITAVAVAGGDSDPIRPARPPGPRVEAVFTEPPIGVPADVWAEIRGRTPSATRSTAPIHRRGHAF